MAQNGSCLARARDALEDRRAQNAAERVRREREVHERLPSVARIDDALRSQMVELFGCTLRHGTDPSPELDALRADSLALQTERAALLEKAGYPADYTDEIFTCAACRDTGYLEDGSMCACLRALCSAELTRDLSGLLKNGDEDFDRFDLTLYDEPARTRMARNLSLCKNFAASFRPGVSSLLLQGGTGLGKTFLSACIARVVAGRGYSVAYETAATALGAFETAKFQRLAEAGEQAADRVERYLDCDLMILDDLGTEMISPYSISALYTLINTRLERGKTTIISTNCTDAELQRNYTPQILSRIEGAYLALPFEGRDIRQVKKERGL